MRPAPLIRRNGPPAVKPCTSELANLNCASLGELIRHFDRTCREQGHESREAAALRSALNKALELEDFGLSKRQENRLNMMAVKRRFPIDDTIKGRMVEVGSNLLEAEDLELAEKGLKALIAMEKSNQADEHHADPQKIEHNHTGSVQLEAKAIRDEYLNNPDYLDFLRQKQIERQNSNAQTIDADAIERSDDEPGTNSGSNGHPGVNGSNGKQR